MAKTQKRSGGQPGNLNAVRNGSKLNLQLRRLTVGELPSAMIAIKREGRKYRRELEAATIEAKGEVSFTDSHYIDTAAAATIAAGICRWLLRNRLDTMSTADIRGCTQDIVKSKTKRDDAVKALKLDAEPADPWNVIEVTTNGSTTHND